MSIGIGDVFVNVIPNMEAFVAEVDAGVTEAAVATETEMGTAAAEGTAAGVAAGEEEGAARGSAGFLSKFKGIAALAGGFFAYEIIKKSINAFDGYEAGVVALKSTLQRAHLGKELPDLVAWTKAFSTSSGVAQEDLLKLERQLTTAGLVGAKKVGDMTNAVEGLSQETGKSVSLFTRSLIPSILNTPQAALTQMEKWKIMTIDQANQVKALMATSQSSVDTLVKNGQVTQAYADSIKNMTVQQKTAAARQMELNLMLIKGKDAYKTTPFEKFKNDLHNIEIQIGSKLMPVLAQMFGYIMRHLPQIEHALNSMWTAFQPTLHLLEKGFEAIGKVVADVFGWFMKGSAPAKTIAAAIGAVAVAVYIALKAFKAWAAFMEIFTKIMDTELLTNPVFLVIAAIALLALVVIMNWGKVKRFLLAVWKDLQAGWHRIWDDIRAVAHSVWDFIVAATKVALKIIIALVLIAMSPIIITFWLVYKAWKFVWDFIGGYVKSVFHDIVELIKAELRVIGVLWRASVAVVKFVWHAIENVIKAAWKVITLEAKVAWRIITAVWHTLQPVFAAIFRGVMTVARPIWNALKDVVVGVWHAIKNAWSGAVSFFSVIWDGILGVAKVALNALITVWNDTIGALAHGQSIKLAGVGITMPNLKIPQLAEGGIVTRPTLILAGERGPEAIQPLSKLSGMIGSNGKQKIRLVVDGTEFAAYIEEVNSNARRAG